MKKNLMRILLFLLTLHLLFSFASCTAEKNGEGETTEKNETLTEDSLWAEALYTDDQTFGSGEKCVFVKVEADGKSVVFTLKTDCENLADALLEHKLIEGEEGDFGLYVKKVNGILADYDVDQTYWSITKDGEMMMTGVSGIKISDGERYELVRTK